MKVIGINNFPYIPQINTRYSTNQTNPIQVNFTGLDRFEKSVAKPFQKEIKKIYTKFEKDMGILQPEDIWAISTNIIAKTGISREEVMKSLDILTQYSSYNSLQKIEKWLYDRHFYGINSLPTGRRFENRDMCLSDVLNYISKKNFRYSQNNNSSAMIVDSKMLHFLDKNNIKYSSYFSLHKPVFIEDFENGYNFLNQSQSLEKFTIEKLKKALQLQEKSGKNLIYNLKYVLNGPTLVKLLKQSITPQVITSKPNKFPTTGNIAQNVNPIMPCFEYFYEAAEEIVQNGELPPKKGEEFVLDFLNNMTEIITPRNYSENLQILNAKIERFIKQNHRDPKKIYYIIPNTEKSFALTNYMYKNANNIKHTKNIILDQKLGVWDTMDKIEKLPNDSTLILMDDYLISGLSMLREQFCYDEILKQSKILQNGNKSIIFAPMFATKCGSREFSNYISFFNRKGLDEIISSKILPEYKEKYIFNSKQKYNKFQTSSILPYMGPDTNVEDLIPLYELFLYNPNAQKACVNNIGDIYDSLY